MALRHPARLDQGGSVAELSRPARALKKTLKEKTQKPQGRKAFRPGKLAIYHNWFTPFLFKQIDKARIVAGGPKWSTHAITKELKKDDPETFLSLNRTTIDE